MKPKHVFPGVRRQHGQTTLWFVAMLAACCCVLALVYNFGQVANEKEKTVNAADASAISGAMIEARMLNFEAYTNRALIANEVSIAQLVSLDSWVKYNYEITQWLDNYFGWIPIVGQVLDLVANGMQAASEGVYAGVEIFIPVIEGMNTGLESARDGVNLVGAVAANAVAGAVANANKTTFGSRYDEQPEEVDQVGGVGVLGAANVYAWSQFTDAYSGDKRSDGRTVILNSRDPFSTHRGNGYLLDFINLSGAVPTLGGLLAPYISIDKTSGSATLKDDYSDWEAQDSADLTLHHPGICGTFPFNYPCVQADDMHVPFGYGRADADSDGSTGDILCWVSPATTNCELALEDNPDNFSWSGPYVQLSGDTGMPDIRDLADRASKGDSCSKNNGSDSASLTFVSAVQKKGAATLTTQRLGMNADTPGPQGSPLMKDNLQNNDQLTSIATACTFFLRPDLNKNDRTQGLLARTDGVHEFASLYNPYWQARLGETDAVTKAALYTLIGANPALSVVTP